jgi:hypothetical protein
LETFEQHEKRQMLLRTTARQISDLAFFRQRRKQVSEFARRGSGFQTPIGGALNRGHSPPFVVISFLFISRPFPDRLATSLLLHPWLPYAVNL